MHNSEELKAIISLLDDPDQTIFSQIKEKLMDIGPAAIPALEHAWEVAEQGELFQRRVENIIHEIQITGSRDALIAWRDGGGKDLLEGMVLIARLGYPDFDRDQVEKTIKQLEKDIWLELNDNLTALEKVKVFNHILFEVHGFAGNSGNYHATQNSFINTVLESKKGNPVSLAAMYIVLASRLGLPIYGVNLPRHFILAFMDTFDQDHIANLTVLFYINPFSKGTVLSRREVQHFLKQIKLEEKPEYFLPCSNIQILIRMLNNIVYSFEQDKNNERAGEMREVLKMLDPNAISSESSGG